MFYILGEQLIKEFLESIRDELLAYMKTEDRNASGRSAASLKVANLTDKSGQLLGLNAIEYVFRGRGPGKMPPLSAIIDWCNARGLPRGMAWFIGRRISEAGTILWQQKRNVLNEIITVEKIDKLKKDILVTFSAKIKTDINTLIAA